MDDVIVFRKILSDVIKLEEGKNEYEIFGNQPRPKSDKRLISLKEQELVQMILFHPDRKAMLMDYAMLLNPTEYDVFAEVQHGIAHPNECPGDVDIIAIPKNAPQKSVAFEVKRVKVTVHEDGTETVNRDKQIEEKGVHQANGLLEKGFHKVFLVVIMVTDGQHKTHKSIPFRYGEQIHKLYTSDRYVGLHPNVGVLIVEITEPTEASYDFSLSYGVHLHKDAQMNEQPLELTEKIVFLGKDILKP